VQCVHVAIVMLQVIDDSIGNTLVAASTLTPEIREKLNGGGAGNKVRMYCAFSVARQARVCQHHSNEKMLFDGRMPLCRELLSSLDGRLESSAWNRTSALSLLTGVATSTTAASRYVVKYIGCSDGSCLHHYLFDTS
jgi:hypothetical protein